MNRDPGGNGPPQLRLAAQLPPDGDSRLELVLAAVTELMRCQREILECVQRLEVSLDELHDRIEARGAAPCEDDADLPCTPTADSVAGPEAPGRAHAGPRPSEEDLLRSIERAMGSSPRDGAD